MTPAWARRAAAPAAELWDRLAAAARDAERFSPSLVASLPEPAQRLLTRSIAVGTPLARAVLLEMEGRLRVGRWLPFQASQVLAPPLGFVWAARAGWGPIAFHGFDRYGDGTGEMQWRLGGVVPVIRAHGADITRSAAGRLAAEAVLVPTTLLDPAVTWRAGEEPDTAIATWQIGPGTAVRGGVARAELYTAPTEATGPHVSTGAVGLCRGQAAGEGRKGSTKPHHPASRPSRPPPRPPAPRTGHTP